MITVFAPSSKSLSHRAVIAASLASGESLLENVLQSKDLERTIAILSASGAEISEKKPGILKIKGVGGKLAGGNPNAPLPCDVHESGTTCRLLTAVLASGKGVFRIYGAQRMHERPIGELVEALRVAGANITYEGRDGCPPLLLETEGLAGGRVEITLDESSQYLSGLLLAAPLAESGLVINIVGKSSVSWPYVGLTLKILDDFGVDFGVQEKENGAWTSRDWRGIKEAVPDNMRFIVAPGAYRARKLAVEGDWSNASYFLAAGTVGTNPVRVKNLVADSLQGDRAIMDILNSMGAKIKVEDNTITAYPAKLRGVEVNMAHCPDLAPTVAIVAAFAEGETRIGGVAHLRLKESNRITAPIKEMRKAGIAAHETDDGMVIYGGMGKPEPGTIFSSHQDHRMAMSLALLGLNGIAVNLDDAGVVGKSFPDFWEVWRKVVKP